MNIRYSQIAQFLKCKKSYDYNYVQNLEPLRIHEKMFLGTAIHAGIEAFFLGKDVVQVVEEICNKQLEKEGLQEEDIENISIIRKSALDIVPRAIDFLPGWEWEPIVINGKKAIEYQFSYKIPEFEDVTFTGTVDLIARHKPTDQVFIIDHKTRGTLKGEDDEQYNLQLAVYQYILGKLGVPVIGTAIYQIKSDPLVTPKINKNFTMSRAKIATTWEFYKRCLLENNLDPVEYEFEMKPKLDAGEFFRLNKIFRSEKTINNIWSRVVIPTIDDIINTSEYVPSITPGNCNYCQYSSLCNAEIDGSDTDYIKHVGFKNKNEQLHKGVF